MTWKKRFKNIGNWCLLMYESIIFSIIPSKTLPKSCRILFNSIDLKFNELTQDEKKIVKSHTCEKGIGSILSFCAFAFGLLGKYGPDSVFRQSGILTAEKIKNIRNKNICCICLSTFSSGSDVKLLPCKHCFHEECIDKWINKCNSCPICRQ
jgi:hypothetical protein